MEIRNTRFVVPVLVLAAAASLSADSVKLRTGKVVQGTFTGADASTVRLLLPNGQRADFPVLAVESIAFSARTPPPPPPDPAVAPVSVLVPKGSMVAVRLAEAIDVDGSKAGMTFRSIVDDPVMLNGKVVIPRGAVAILQAAKVEQSGKIKGSDNITLKMNSISLGGRTYDVVTTYVETKGEGEGKKSTRKIAGGAGLGAIIGGIAGGGTGAAIGAAVGGGAGLAMSASGEEHLKLAAETRLQFQLSAAVSIQP
jgi:hypothetical protein